MYDLKRGEIINVSPLTRDSTRIGIVLDGPREFGSGGCCYWVLQKEMSVLMLVLLKTISVF